MEPAQNRVSPCGDILAAPGRGAWMGNRGVLHRGDGTREVVRRFRTRAWIICTLSFRDRVVPQWQPGRYTPLFFLDEAVALAAGHRPCAECRRPSFDRYRAAWSLDGALPRAGEMDAQLHTERLATSGRGLHELPWSELPDGVFVTVDDLPAVVVGTRLRVHDPTTNRYAGFRTRPTVGVAPVITPPSTVRVLTRGYPVELDAGTRGDAPKTCR